MNAMWRLNTRDGIAYVENRALALTLLRSGIGKTRDLDRVMAVYMTARGRAFAWQIRFPYEQWSAVAQALDSDGESPALVEPALPPEAPAAPVEPPAAPKAGKPAAAAAKSPSVDPPLPAPTRVPAVAATTRSRRPKAAPTPAPAPTVVDAGSPTIAVPVDRRRKAESGDAPVPRQASLPPPAPVAPAAVRAEEATIAPPTAKPGRLRTAAATGGAPPALPETAPGPLKPTRRRKSSVDAVAARSDGPQSLETEVALPQPGGRRRASSAAAEAEAPAPAPVATAEAAPTPSPSPARRRRVAAAPAPAPATDRSDPPGRKRVAASPGAAPEAATAGTRTAAARARCTGKELVAPVASPMGPTRRARGVTCAADSAAAAASPTAMPEAAHTPAARSTVKRVGEGMQARAKAPVRAPAEVVAKPPKARRSRAPERAT